MTRSVFQINKKQIDSVEIKISTYILVFLVIFVLIDNNSFISCFSFRGINQSVLKELQHNNIIFKHSITIPKNKVIESIDTFLLNDCQKLNLNITKYYEFVDGLPKTFHKNYPYAHPNLCIGIFEDLFFNYQFSHFNYNRNFEFFTSKDIFGILRSQNICNQIYIYDNVLGQQFINFNSLHLNKYLPYNHDITKSINSQNYLNIYDFHIRKIILNSIKV